MSRTRSMRARPGPQLETEEKMRERRSLQDITDRFVPIPSPANNSPIPKSEWKAKTTRAAKLPSSLPPSSPPSNSSNYSQSRPVYNAHFMSPFFSDSDQENIDFELPQFGRHIADGYTGYKAVETSPALDASDPFGFFAVERKLKVQRALHHTSKPNRHRLALPSIDTFQAEHLEVPPTPHKRHGICQTNLSPVPSGSGVISLDANSMPSTPSPSKRAVKKRKRKAVGEIDNSMDVIPPLNKELEGTPQSEGSSGGSTETPNISLRVQPIRRAAAGAKRARKITHEYHRGGTNTKRKGAEMRAKAVSEKPSRKPRAAHPTNKGTDVDAHHRERWERERQQRLAYFKKLENYQIEKENVYVI